MAQRPDSLAALIAHPFAHRGLHDATRIENGGPAFDAAVAGGFGIECDVQASRDARPMVFHDDALGRLTGRHGPVDRFPAAALCRFALNGDNGTILPLAAMLRRCGPDTPVLVEIKAHGPDVDRARFCRAIAAPVTARASRTAVMSFDAGIIAWFARNRPRLTRGLVVGRAELSHLGSIMALARPHFIAADVALLADARLQHVRATMPLLTWTVRTAAQRAFAAAHADQIIFEGDA